MSFMDKVLRFFRKKDVVVLPADEKGEVVIEVKDLVMEFKVSKDKIDTLKEYVIRTIKRNKKEKQEGLFAKKKRKRAKRKEE